MRQGQKRIRRSSETVHALILSSARQLFSERGYRASTRDIAQLAGVTETLIFRRFGSKARLFETVLSEFLIEFYEAFDQQHVATDADDEEFLAYRSAFFVRQLFRKVGENRQLIFAYLSALEFEPDLRDMRHSDGLKDYFERAERHLKRRYALLKIEPRLPPAMTARLAFTTIVASVLFRNWVFDDREMARAGFADDLGSFVSRDFPGPADGKVVKLKP